MLSQFAFAPANGFLQQAHCQLRTRGEEVLAVVQHQEQRLRPEEVRQGIQELPARLFADPELRARLAEAGRRTAAGYAWEPQIAKLERFLESVAGEPATAPQRSAAPRG